MKQAKRIIEVSLNGDTQYMTPDAYREFTLQLSTGDFHVHQKRELKRLPKGVNRWQVRDAVYFNPRLAYPTIESIIEAYNSTAKSCEEYAESEESPLAEYVSSFWYGETDALEVIKNHSRFSSETVEALTAYYKKFGNKKTQDLMLEHAKLELTGIYYQGGEFCGATIGEQEHQPDDTLIEAFQTLTDAEQETVCRATDGYVSRGSCKGWVYTSHDYDRWVMILDEESCVEAIKNTKGLKRSLKAVSRG